MGNFSYENIPQLIDPVVFHVGTFSLRWYAVMWLVSFAVAWWLLLWRVRNDKIAIGIVEDIVIVSFFGAIFGGRIGYVFFYNFTFFIEQPLTIVSPFIDGQFVGIGGMSFHGGLIGAIFALFLYSYKKKISFLYLMDCIAPVVPLGYMFGRFGNFFNHELWGRVTDSPLGMFFEGAHDSGFLLRHPSQLYEAFFEGFVLFVILWLFRNRFVDYPGMLLALYIFGYGSIRFFLEFFREPDAHIGMVVLFFTMGQILSLAMMIFGIFLAMWFIKNPKKVKSVV